MADLNSMAESLSSLTVMEMAELSKMLERLTQEEVQDFLRLLNKAKGVSVEPNQLTAGRKEDEDDEKSN